MLCSNLSALRFQTRTSSDHGSVSNRPHPHPADSSGRHHHLLGPLAVVWLPQHPSGDPLPGWAAPPRNGRGLFLQRTGRPLHQSLLQQTGVGLELHVCPGHPLRPDHGAVHLSPALPGPEEELPGEGRHGAGGPGNRGAWLCPKPPQGRWWSIP